jgi:hypothetical protein
MNESLHLLREMCKGISQQSLGTAVTAGLRGLVQDDREREAVAALLTAWLLDENETSEVPPLSPVVIESIRRNLPLKTH